MSDTDRPPLYLVTPAGMCGPEVVDLAARALDSGLVACLRLDCGDLDEGACKRAADSLLPLCHGADVPLLVAEHHGLVAPLGLDGVHLGTSDARVSAVRKAIGKDRVIGASGGASRHRAITLAEAGVDYVALGPVSAPADRPESPRAEDELFAWWAEMIEVPVVAEGGATLEDARRLGASVDFLVPAHAIWQSADIAADLRAYASALDG